MYCNIPSWSHLFQNELKGQFATLLQTAIDSIEILTFLLTKSQVNDFNFLHLLLVWNK